MRGCRDEPKQPDPLTPEVFLAYGSNRGAYGARKIKAVLERRGFCASRRRIGRIMKESGLVGAYAKAEFKAHVGNPNEADLPNIVAREFDGHAPHTHVVSDLTVSVNTFFTISANTFSPIAPPLFRRPRHRGCAASG